MKKIRTDFARAKSKPVDDGLIWVYASTFGNVDSYNETVLPTAFDRWLREFREAGKSMVPVYLEHERWSSVGPAAIGKIDAANIEIDDVGLIVGIDLTPGHAVAQNTRASVDHGTVTGASIGYRMYQDGYTATPSGIGVLSAIDLVEVSLTERPADDFARRIEKSDIDGITSMRQLESNLRDAGYSRAAAKAVIHAAKSLNQRDAEDDCAQNDAVNLIREIKSILK
jgi:HK97 family phage prohead protease